MNTPEKKEELARSLSELKTKEKTEPVASFLGMRLLELTPGCVKVAMKLRREYQNFNGLVFGGVIMALADQAFAYASNSLAYPSFAAQFNIHFIAGAGAEDELTAECRVIKSGLRAGISEINITNQDGKLIALATGTTIPVAKLTG